MKNIRIATWNISCGMDIDRNIIKTNYIYDSINKHDIDILLLQEVITDTKTGAITLNDIINHTGLQYGMAQELSPSHKLDNSYMGIAILSKYPLSDKTFIETNNLGIKIIKDGLLREAHKKGFLFARIPQLDLFLGVGHFPSFNYFGKDETDYKDLIYTPMEDRLTEIFKHERYAIIGGDFNTAKIPLMMPKMCADNKQIINGINRSRGVQTDYIFTNGGLMLKNSFIVKGIIDHYLSIADVDIV